MLKRHHGRNPEWLNKRWEEKRQQTADRVSAAIGHLQKQGLTVSIAAICHAVQELFGFSMAPSTIKRNELAFANYVAARKHVSYVGVRGTTLELLASAPADGRPKLRAKIRRLRRETKDELIGRVLKLEETVGQQRQLECKLRDEIVHAALRR